MPRTAHNRLRVTLERAARRMGRTDRLAEAEAEGEVAAVYESIRQTLRLPFVGPFFETLAAGPPFLAPAWRQVAEMVGTEDFEQRADRLRRRAARLVAPRMPRVAVRLPAADEVHLRDHIDTVHYAIPKVQLVCALFERIRQGDVQGHERLEAAPLARGPVPAVRAALLEEGDLERAVAHTLAQIRRRHDHPMVSAFYSGLANWPLALQTLWDAVAREVGTVGYVSRSLALHECARSLVAGIALEPLPEAAARTPQEDAELDGLLEVFALRLLPDTLQDTILVKAALDGPQTTADSRFSAAHVRLRGHQPW